MLLSDVCLSHTSGLSREQRPRKTKIGTEVAHVTRDSDTTFKVKRSNAKVTRPLYSPPCWRVRQLQRWALERVGRGKLLLRCRLLGGVRPFGAHGGGVGGGISWRPPAYSLFCMHVMHVPIVISDNGLASAILTLCRGGISKKSLGMRSNDVLFGFLA